MREGYFMKSLLPSVRYLTSFFSVLGTEHNYNYTNSPSEHITIMDFPPQGLCQVVQQSAYSVENYLQFGDTPYSLAFPFTTL